MIKQENESSAKDILHEPRENDDWYITGDDGHPVAYKRRGEDPVFLDIPKALAGMSKLICDKTTQVSVERGFNNGIFTGLFFGYPPCCIREYLDDVRNGINPIMTRNVPGNSSGFIPCREHTKEVLAGHITLESLLSNRACELPFDRSTILPAKRRILDI